MPNLLFWSWLTAWRIIFFCQIQAVGLHVGSHHTARGIYHKHNVMASPSMVMMQSRNAFVAFPPIEQPASAAEVAAMLEKAPTGVSAIVFPEGREQPIRMQRKLPVEWTERDLSQI